MRKRRLKNIVGKTYQFFFEIMDDSGAKETYTSITDLENSKNTAGNVSEKQTSSMEYNFQLGMEPIKK